MFFEYSEGLNNIFNRKTMGSNTSKSDNEVIHTQKNENENTNLDPRSPTPEITRTPLHNKNATKHNITKNVDLRKAFENAKDNEKLVHNNPILSAVIKSHLQSYDPRSPTQDFERTPIIIASKINDLANNKHLLKLQSEETCGSPYLRDDNETECYPEAEETPALFAPKNLCDGFFNMTIDETFKDNEQPLGSSTVSNEAIETNMSKEGSDKQIKLLETNFDYVESDVEKFEDSESNVDTNYNSDNDNKPIAHYEILDVDPRSPSAEIDRTPIVVAKIQEEPNEDNIEEMSDDTLIKVLQNTNTELRQTVANPDRKLDDLLIYEDETPTINTPKKSKSVSDSGGSRTPLSCMKNKTETGHNRSKSGNTLYSPKTQKIVSSKIPKRSYIPRLKSLSKQTNLIPTGSSTSLKNISKTSAISGDCENTPPHSHRDKWDKDNSIVL